MLIEIPSKYIEPVLIYASGAAYGNLNYYKKNRAQENIDKILLDSAVGKIGEIAVQLYLTGVCDLNFYKRGSFIPDVISQDGLNICVKSQSLSSVETFGVRSVFSNLDPILDSTNENPAKQINQIIQ